MNKLRVGFLLACFSAGAIASVSLMSTPTFAETQIRKTPTYTGVKLNIPAELNIAVGKNAETKIDASAETLQNITSTVQNGVLVISSKNSHFNLKKLVINCSTAVLDKLTLDGATTTNVSGLSKGRLEIAANGSSTISLKGKLDDLNCDFSGSSTLKAAELKSKNALVKISGAGTANLDVAEKLKVKIAGAGTVKYAGDPKVEKEILGAGTVSKI